jgi:nucleoside-diphosphate-sugar epimerase
MVKTKALISGGNGFIGTHLQKALRERDIEVHLLPRKHLYGSSSDLETYLSVIEPDYIYHLAAYGNHYQQENEELTILANYFGTWNLLSASNKLPYKAFINVSSSSVLLPTETFYSATKAGAERLCRAFVQKYDKPIVTVRPYSVYGPDEAEHRFIPTVFRSCLLGEPMTLAPDAVHDWVYVEDFIKELLIAAGQAKRLKGKEIEIGTGIGTTNKRIVSNIESITGKKAKIIEHKQLRQFDTKDWVSKRRMLDNVLMQDGLERIYEHIVSSQEKDSHA